MACGKYAMKSMSVPIPFIYLPPHSCDHTSCPHISRNWRLHQHLHQASWVQDFYWKFGGGGVQDNYIITHSFSLDPWFDFSLAPPMINTFSASLRTFHLFLGPSGVSVSNPSTLPVFSLQEKSSGPRRDLENNDFSISWPGHNLRMTRLWGAVQDVMGCCYKAK